MLGPVRRILRTTDAAIASAYLSLVRERSALLCFLFHSLFADEQESEQNLVHPLQRTTVAQFRRFIAYYLRKGYQFIGVPELLAGLKPGGRYALITFDDGYFNNSRALPVLEEFKVPALFFISTDNVRRGRCFWWDVHWRETAGRGVGDDAIVRDGKFLKALRTEHIEDELSGRHGASAFTPRGDVDRPFTPQELREFSRNPYVQIGNHTAGHAILTNYPLEDAGRQIGDAQDALQEMTGQRPLAIAYPNGAHSDEIERLCGGLGLKCGFTVQPNKTSLPLELGSENAMRIGRFAPDAEDTMERQCLTFRSDLQMYGRLHAGYWQLKKLRRGLRHRRRSGACGGGLDAPHDDDEVQVALHSGGEHIRG